MTTNMTLAEIDAEILAGATVADFVVAQAAIAREIASVRIRPGVAEMLAALPIRYGVCSNLSADYVGALDRLPEISPAFRILSCFAGCMKPDQAIYDNVIQAAGVPASRILFVGDTPAADIDGPLHAGVGAIHIDQACGTKILWVSDAGWDARRSVARHAGDGSEAVKQVIAVSPCVPGKRLFASRAAL